jgi:uncharacterized RDD family membrane protein YckC
MSRDADLVVVTPEHVEVVLTPAGLGSRFLALAIDSIITMGMPLLLVRLLGVVLSAGVGLAIYLTAQFFFTFVYHVYFESRRQGRTLGKRALGLRVVDARGLPITAPQSLVRNAFRALDALPFFYGLAAVAAIIDRRGRRFGDVVAQTMVIEERAAVGYEGAALSERRFNSLRTPRVLRLIRHRINLEERELLLELCLRAERLEPSRRYALMEEFGDHYRKLLEVDDPRLSGENLVRDLTSILFSQRAERLSA